MVFASFQSVAFVLARLRLIIVDRVLCRVCACGARRFFCFSVGYWEFTRVKCSGVVVVGASVSALWFAIVFGKRVFFRRQCVVHTLSNPDWLHACVRHVATLPG